MLTTLALRHLAVRRARSAVLLFGFALGVGVMIVLLSVGEAMLEQSRDVRLVGGGQVTVVPQGIDVEAMRTGAISGLFFGIDRARFLTRVWLGGGRHGDTVATVSPVLEHKLVYLTVGGRTVAARAGGELPSRAAALGAGLDVVAGRWADSPADSAWMAPTPQQLYDQMDRFHLPARPDSTWGEWHYFNVVTGPDEWWYITYLVGGALPAGRWGGQLLVSHRRPDGGYERFAERIAPEAVTLDTTRADLALGAHTVRQRDGRYQLHARTAGLAFDLEVTPAPRRYFPPVELGGDDFVSGYVVPALSGTARGTLCVRGACRALDGVRAYHDHNWGVWRDVTWEWGGGQGATFDLLYGGVRAPGVVARGGASPFFLALADSLGARQVLRFREVRFEGSRPADGAAARAPERFALVAVRDADTVRLRGEVLHAAATAQQAGSFTRTFLQLRARWRLDGTLGGRPVRDEGLGFFETFLGR
ncbi:MAG: hypothetical protein NW201_05990 [Gemmatimonadales bacterium]|nr:hypothetical protein [Gemmatimonadales bacterium]